MITEEIKIPTTGRPIEAYTMHQEKRPDKAFLILPGKGYTINHFLLDFLWRMAAEAGYYAIKAEYRGYTYRHMGEPHDAKQAIQDAGFIFEFLADQGFKPGNIVPCTKSLGTIALAGMLENHNIYLQKAVLLTPVMYYKKGSDTLSLWSEFNTKVTESYVVFGTEDPFCDLDTAATIFPTAAIDCCEGADHGLYIVNDYKRTIKINEQIIEKVNKFIL